MSATSSPTSLRNEHDSHTLRDTKAAVPRSRSNLLPIRLKGRNARSYAQSSSSENTVTPGSPERRKNEEELKESVIVSAHFQLAVEYAI